MSFDTPLLLKGRDANATSCQGVVLTTPSHAREMIIIKHIYPQLPSRPQISSAVILCKRSSKICNKEIWHQDRALNDCFCSQNLHVYLSGVLSHMPAAGFAFSMGGVVFSPDASLKKEKLKRKKPQLTKILYLICQDGTHA